MTLACLRPARRTLVAVTTAALVLVTSLATASPAQAGITSGSYLAPVSPALATAIATLPKTTPYGAYVNVRGGSAADRATLLADHGLNVVTDFPSIGVAYGTGSLGAIATLRRAPQVSYLSTDSALKLLDDTSGWATRVEQVQRAMGNGPYRDAAGRVLNGTGIGVAVVDSGIDGTHPDLASRMVRNTKYKCSSMVLVPPCFGVMMRLPLANTDPSSGHGSHVAGIVAGDGTASQGTFRGVAPGASLYGFGIGDGDRVWTSEVAAAFQDILDSNAAGTNTPPIRIVTNSWGNGAGSVYNPNDVISLLVKQLVASGVTVLFAAGNGDATGNGGDGSADRLSSTAKDPTPGVITVANYDDAGTGTRDGELASSSSRGKRGVPTAYPDLSAPGSGITSTCLPAQAICATGAFWEWQPYYQQLTGTSMATPAVAGMVALLLQARPTLTPTQLESLLQDTAYKFGDSTTYEADPQNPGGTVSFDKGAGLVDMQAALDALGVAHDGGESVQGTPAVAISAPADGAVNDGTAPLSVTGTASDGYVAPKPFVSQVIATGDGGDLGADTLGAIDIAGLSVIETATGLRYKLTARDLTDVNPLNPPVYVVRSTINGVAYASEVFWDGTTATPGTDTNSLNNAPPTDVTADLATNSVSFSVPFTLLGNPGPLTPAIKAFAQSYVGYPVDYAPGGSAAVGPVNTAPEYGAFLIRRPSLTGPPATTVTLAVDGGTAVPQVLAPDFSWVTSVDTTGLADGSHTLTATVLTDGVPRATRTVSFTVQRPVIVTSSVAVTAPGDGSRVERVVVPISGTSTSNAPAAQLRAVTVQVTGTGFDSGPLTATGTDSWTLPFDFSTVAAGSYLLTARLTLDGVVAATASRMVLVPAAAVLVSCAPRALSFWQNQFNASNKAVFTTAEANALADKAVSLSSGYFGSRSALVNVLYAKGKLPPETAAAQQYAPLLLNLAAGQLSATMSTQLGLSGKETLDPAVYDTARVGTTVGSAATWIRNQFSLGDLGGAQQAAINLNNRTGLTC